MLLLAGLGISQFSHAADESAHLFGYAHWFNPGTDPKHRIFVPMDAKRDNGIPWVFYYYIGVMEGDNGETRFEALPDGIAMDITDAYIGFSSQSMGKGEPPPFKILQVLLNKHLASSYPLIEPPDLTGYDPKQLRYQTLLKPYHNERLLREPVSFGISLVRTEQLKPVALYVITGQGPVPEEIQQLIDQTHGSWFQRYRHIIFALAIVLAAFYGYYRYASR